MTAKIFLFFNFPNFLRFSLIFGIICYAIKVKNRKLQKGIGLGSAGTGTDFKSPLEVLINTLKRLISTSRLIAVSQRLTVFDLRTISYIQS